MPTRRDGPELKLIKGAEPRERETRSPKPARREPQPPDWFTEAHRALWDHVVDELREMGQLFRADALEIVNYVVVAHHCQRAAQELEKQTGYTVSTVQGGLASHPLVSVLDRLVGRAHTLAKHLGLNPAGRSTIYGRSAHKDNTEVAHADLDLFA